MEVVSRAQILQEQTEWEGRKAKEVSVTPNGDGSFTLHGVDMHNFHDMIGPERSYRYLAVLGEVEIIEPTLFERSKNLAKRLLERVMN